MELTLTVNQRNLFILEIHILYFDWCITYFANADTFLSFFLAHKPFFFHFAFRICMMSNTKISVSAATSTTGTKDSATKRKSWYLLHVGYLTPVDLPQQMYWGRYKSIRFCYHQWTHLASNYAMQIYCLVYDLSQVMLMPGELMLDGTDEHH